MVQRIVAHLRDHGHDPAIAMRGYACKHAGLSDEAELYKSAFDDLPIVAQPRRQSVAQRVVDGSGVGAEALREVEGQPLEGVERVAGRPPLHQSEFILADGRAGHPVGRAPLTAVDLRDAVADELVQPRGQLAARHHRVELADHLGHRRAVREGPSGLRSDRPAEPCRGLLAQQCDPRHDWNSPGGDSPHRWARPGPAEP